MRKLISCLNTIKLWVKNGFLLYISSWKRSFDFRGLPREGEFANFLKISAGILITLLTMFFIIWWRSSGFYIPVSLSVLAFWCYGAVAFLPFSGIVARRFNMYDIDFYYADKVFGFLWFVIIFFIYFIKEAMLQSFVYNFYTLSYGISSLVVLMLFCYKLKNMAQIKKKYEAYKNEKKIDAVKRFLAIFGGAFIGVAVLWLEKGDVNQFLSFSAVDSVVDIVMLLILSLVPACIITILMSVRWGRLLILFWLLFWFLGVSLSQLKGMSSNLFRLFDAPSYVRDVSFLICALVFFMFLLCFARKIKIYLVLGVWMVAVPFCIWEDISGFYKEIGNSDKVVGNIGDEKINALTVPVLKNLVQQKTDKNYLISIHNLYQGLAMFANGAEGVTLDKLKMLLGGSSLEEINQKSKEVIKNHSIAFNFDNRVYVDVESLDSSFKNILNEYFDVSFEMSRNCAVVVRSELRFDAPWEDDFHKEETYFYAPKGEVLVQSFGKRITGNLARGDGFRVLELPYKSGDVFYILLPDEGKDLKNIVEKFDVNTFRDLFFEYRKVEVEIPEFTITERVELQSILGDLGLSNLFVPYQAELKKVMSSAGFKKCGETELYISEFYQKNEIIVSKKGTKAVSVQVGIMNVAGGTAVPLHREYWEPFIVNRPFIYMVNNGAFVGIVYDPSEK